MTFSKLLTHKTFGVAIVLVANTFLTNVYATHSWAAISHETTSASINNEANSTEFLTQRSEEPSWWWPIIDRKKGSAGQRSPSGKNSVCALPPQETHSRFMWNETPRFVWFSDLPNLHIKIRASDDLEFKWEKTVENSEGDHLTPHITSYDGEQLNSEELYHFEIYAYEQSDEPLSQVAFKIMPESDRLELDKELNNLSVTEDADILQRMNYFSTIKYSENLRFQSDNKNMFLFFDIINELLDFNSLEERNRQLDKLRGEYCGKQN